MICLVFVRASGEHCGEAEEQQLQEALKAHGQDILVVGMRCAVLKQVRFNETQCSSKHINSNL
jgi:UDP-N-acetyl-D-mannosaminuronic acid transferase (WecB/TagA/CpsF family)